ncbi:MAG: phosphate signaling complex protein PhoU [Firmicutes bacterium]|nr:phosphate signaling complex protein PhoU [Bacillota bacterium]
MTTTAVNGMEKVELHLRKMGDLAQELMKMAIEALRDQNMDLARKVIERDDQIDNLEIVIQEEIERMLSAGSQVGFDVRRKIAALKIAQDLERIGDYATNIAEVVLELKNETFMKPLIHIPQLAVLAMNMVATVLKAFLEENTDLAEAVCRKDEEADNLYSEICEELVRIIGKGADPRKAYQASRFLLIAEWLERTADHTTNIGEETIYITTGKRVKY